METHAHVESYFNEEVGIIAGINIQDLERNMQSHQEASEGGG